jgi:curli biogenesis system outer membrane secretion channel CsgG
MKSGSDRASGDLSASRSASSEGHVKGEWKNQGAEHDSASAAYSKSAAKASASAYVKDESHFALSIKEYFPDGAQIALPDSAAAAEISSLLLKDDFNLVDKAFVQQLREAELGKTGYMVDYLKNNSKVALAAQKAAKDYGADYLVIGACNVVYRGPGEGKQQISGANLILKVVNTSTGQVVAAVTNSEPGMSGDVQSSRNVAAKRVGTTVGEALVAQLSEQGRNRARNGIEIDLKLYGVLDLPAKVAFSSVLEGLDGVQTVEERVYDRSNHRIEYQVTYRGTVTQFKNILYKHLFADHRWQGIDEQLSTGNNVNLVLKAKG